MMWKLLSHKVLAGQQMGCSTPEMLVFVSLVYKVNFLLSMQEREAQSSGTKAAWRSGGLFCFGLF